MNWPHKIIAGSYLYILGIVFAMLMPVDPSVLPWLRTLVTMALLVTGALLVLAMLQEDVKTPFARAVLQLVWPFLVLGMMLLGYTRYISANTVLDQRVGEIVIEGESRRVIQDVEWNEGSRLRLRKLTEVPHDFRIRVLGSLDARVPVKDSAGNVVMDEQGRWMFDKVTVNMNSEMVTIYADDPIGTEYEIEQPFSRIEGVSWFDDPLDARLAVYRVSNHISTFVRPARAQAPVTVLGRITSDPRVYDFQTVLMVTPSFIQFPPGGHFYRVEGGDIQVTINPDLDGYENFARTAAYGADVQIESELTVARAESNPGGFNARQFMQNYNIFGLMRPFQPRDEPAPMQMVIPTGQEHPREGHWLVSFSLDLRDRVLLLFKQTMPHPQSAFLGGVTLGLRYGLQGAQFPGEGEAGPIASRLGLGRSEAQIVGDFRSAGVNHVLAVSGLHVTILTVMFTAIFALLKFPKQVFVPFVIFALVVFAIITGARPSTLRAVIMNSLFLMTWAYLNKGLLSSVLIGVPVAAFLILIHNPLVVVDPSFTLSFGAILSLALITMPIHDRLSLLRGNRLAVVTVFVCVTTVLGVIRWTLITTPSFIFPWLLLGWGIYILAAQLDRKGIGLPSRFAFTALPDSVSTFVAAQIAIQIGMMVPLSAYYFVRWPFAGAYANLIAIPLIGVVVQLGAIAGLLGLIPIVGPFITLVLNAANWIFATVFLWLAHISATIFPHPFVRRPRVIEVLVYYLFLAALVWHKPLWKGIKALCARFHWTHRRAPVAVLSGLAIIALIPLWIAPPRDTRPEGLHITMLSVGYGSAILVESPGGQRILVDAGFVEHERGRRNEAERTILPYFSHAAIRRLDGLILTSPLPERAAGVSYILSHQRVDQLILPPALMGLSSDMPFFEVMERLGLRDARADEEERWRMMYHELISHPNWPRRPSLAKALAGRDDTLMNRLAQWRTVTTPAQPGDVLFAEDHEGKAFRIEVLGPLAADGLRHPIENQSIVLRVVYGDFAVLLPSALHFDGVRQLMNQWSSEALRANVLVVPHHGTANPGRSDRPARDEVWQALERYQRPLLESVQPERAIFEFGNPRPVLGMDGRTAINLFDLSRQFYAEIMGADNILSTDQDLAIFIHSDGRTYTIETQAERNRARGGDDDTVSDLSVGL